MPLLDDESWRGSQLRLARERSAIPLDFIDMYCFEYQLNLRYSRGVLNNISIKEYTQPLRRCGCALVCKLCCQQAGNLEFGVLCRKKQDSSLHFCRCQSQKGSTTPKFSYKPPQKKV